MKTVPREVLDFLHGLYHLQSTAETSEWIVNGLARLFHAENAILCRHDGTQRIITAVVAQHPFSRANLMPHINESGIMALHPFWETTFSPEHPVRPLSLVASRQAWHANPLYNEVFRPDGIEDQLNTEVLGDDAAFTTVNVLRARRGFSQREIELLGLLREHIAQALTNAGKIEQADVFGSIHGRSFIIPLDYHGRPRSQDLPVHQLLAGTPLAGGRLPVGLRNWIAVNIRALNEGWLQTRCRSFVSQETGRRCEFFLHRDWNNGGYLLVAIPENQGPGLEILSQRENDIMGWVEKGKTNEDIAQILGLSINTVKTHLKSAFVKLGVENRTAAVSAWSRRPLA
jgi:DNA-binding CsgD family transcriptional regulator